ncbi:ketopantoate reductase family protein [Neobacillus kokaensis]|uniref:2-dehydropantoate 2-reductase n=1 Tax=Neobacillus kokaensis TaxID=2759023 RepID=A0ABQ3N5N3_9BACI|nr:2-dehydropantoate 2-reductase [Neobacillus kokaensis]GHH99376.1 hypothetical protein AM1BK_29190 [Neobacillus kokaensis]
MKITVIGAGAIGGVIGAYLARAGENVTFVDIARDHVNAMKQSGLRIEAVDEVFTVPVKAMTVVELLASREPLDVVFLAVKAQDTEEAVLQVMDKLHDTSAVVSLQNGLCENIISSLVGQKRTIGCFVNLFADYISPGYIKYGGVGSLYIGELDGSVSSRLKEIHRVLQHWGQAKITDNIWGYLWGKLSYASVLIATALVDEKIADVIDPMENREWLVELASETLRVADKLNIQPMGFDDWEPSIIFSNNNRDRDWDEVHRQLDKHIQRLRTYKKVKTGFWRDLAIHKRKTEVPFYLHPVIELGDEVGVQTPLIQKVLSMIIEIEEGKRQMSWGNIDELRSLYSCSGACKELDN